MRIWIYNHDRPILNFPFFFWVVYLKCFHQCCAIIWILEKELPVSVLWKINQNQRTVSPFNFKNCNKSLVFRTSPGGRGGEGRGGPGGFMDLGFFKKLFMKQVCDYFVCLVKPDREGFMWLNALPLRSQMWVQYPKIKPIPGALHSVKIVMVFCVSTTNSLWYPEDTQGLSQGRT